VSSLFAGSAISRAVERLEPYWIVWSFINKRLLFLISFLFSDRPKPKRLKDTR
jgi:hypothetical protein